MVNQWSKCLTDRNDDTIFGMEMNTKSIHKTIVDNKLDRKTTEKEFQSKLARSGIIGRMLQPKGLHTTVIYYTLQTFFLQEVGSPSSTPLALEPIVRHSRPWATWYITVRFCTYYHQVLSSRLYRDRSYLTICLDNKEILLPLCEYYYWNSYPGYWLSRRGYRSRGIEGTLWEIIDIHTILQYDRNSQL